MVQSIKNLVKAQNKIKGRSVLSPKVGNLSLAPVFLWSREWQLSGKVELEAGRSSLAAAEGAARLEGFQQIGLAENPLAGLVGLFLVVVVDPEPLASRGDRIVSLGSLGLRTAVAVVAVAAVEGRAGLVVVEQTAVVVVVVAAVAVALWVVAGGWRPSTRSPRAERSRPSTDVMSASERTGKTLNEELLQLHSASI